MNLHYSTQAVDLLNYVQGIVGVFEIGTLRVARQWRHDLKVEGSRILWWPYLRLRTKKCDNRVGDGSKIVLNCVTSFMTNSYLFHKWKTIDGSLNTLLKTSKRVPISYKGRHLQCVFISEVLHLRIVWKLEQMKLQSILFMIMLSKLFPV